MKITLKRILIPLVMVVLRGTVLGIYVNKTSNLKFVKKAGAEAIAFLFMQQKFVKIIQYLNQMDNIG